MREFSDMLSISPKTCFAGVLTMNRYIITLLFWTIIMFEHLFVLPTVALTDEGLSQMRIAYFELSRIQLLNMLNVSYEEYRDAVMQSREQILLLRDDSSAGADILRAAQANYERALVVWRLQIDARAPVDSMLIAEPDVLAVCRQYQDIPIDRFNGNGHVSVQEAVACLWRLSAAVLNEMPSTFH